MIIHVQSKVTITVILLFESCPELHCQMTYSATKSITFNGNVISRVSEQRLVFSTESFAQY